MDVQMPSGLVIPSTLKYSLYRMIQDAAISTNVLRLVPLNLQTVKSGGLISVRLPLATCSLPSFSMSFNNYISTFPTYQVLNDTAGWAATGTTHACAHSFPQGLESLIQRLEIVVAGVSLMTLPNYNSMYQVLKDLNQGLDQKISRNMVEGENDVVPAFELNQASTVAQPITCYNWYCTNSSTNLTVTCTASCPGEITVGSVAFNAPPAVFFGFQGQAAMTSYPVITRVAPRPFQSTEGSAYTAFNSYIIDILYVAPSSTWSPITASSHGATGNTTTIYAYPFSFNAAPSGTTTQGTIAAYTPNTESNTIRDFLGFFKAAPKAIQLAALGEVEIRIYLEQKENVIVSAPPWQTLALFTSGTDATINKMTGSADYTLTNIEFQVRTMSWDNGWLDSMMQSELAGGGTLEIPYPNYYSVVQGSQPQGQTTTRFSVNTQNLRQVWAINKPSLQISALAQQQLYVPSSLGPKYNGTLAPTHKGFFFADSASFPSLWSAIPVDGGFAGKTISSASYAGLASAPNKWQYLINNQLVPNLQVAPQRTYAFTQEILGKEDWQELGCMPNPATYYTSGYAMGITLEYLDKYADDSVRSLFGLDTRSASSVFYLNQSNSRFGDTTYIFSMFTSVLRVAMNNQVQVII